MTKFKKVSALLLVIAMLFSQVVFAEGEAVVVINGAGVEKELSLTLDELKAMPEEAQIDEEYIYNSKTGEKTVTVKGVSLAYVLRELAGLKVEEAEVAMVASDGYPIDPQMLTDIMAESLKYVIAYEVNGLAIDNDENPETDEIVVYRKVKESGEFGTVFKLVAEITVGEAIEPIVEEPVVEDPVAEEPAAVVFTDLTDEFAFAKSAIEGLAQKGIVNGKGNDLFDPAGSFTRAEFCKIAVVSLGYELVEYKGGFSDVKASDWFAPYVQTAVDNGIFTGYPDGTFMPIKVINRQEIAAVAGRAAVMAEVVAQEKLNKFVMEKSNYEDKLLVPEWAANEVAWLEAQGVFAGVAEGQFQPTKVVNRAEAAVIVYNTLFAEQDL
ncbi:S-layer homology domain-containing protein [Gudongella oleilytica]|nr:S-layer homology domain-containing protein [Gudongella oleilytica]MDY0257138.1 S-layer homology domain-containing protein [Gudongella oleilytica]